jgi:hypothetical protein
MIQIYQLLILYFVAIVNIHWPVHAYMLAKGLIEFYGRECKALDTAARRVERDPRFSLFAGE